MNDDFPETGKVFLAANPWPLAAELQRRGLDTSRLRESDLVPDGQLVVVDLDAISDDLASISLTF